MEARTRLYVEWGAWRYIETGSKQKVCICVPKADKCCVACGEIGTMRYKALVGTGMGTICAGEKQKCAKKADACGQKQFYNGQSGETAFLGKNVLFHVKQYRVQCANV